MPKAEEPAPVKELKPVDSIQNDKVFCLECGAKIKVLTQKHLVIHGMDQKEYRKKYGFTMRTPLAAKSLTKARQKAAKKRGLPENLQKNMEARKQAKAEVSKPTTEPVGVSKPIAAKAIQEQLLKEKPVLTPENSIQNDKVICLECGAEFKQLTKMHLLSHGMSPNEYKRKYGFPKTTPLAAKSLITARQATAQKTGLSERMKQFGEAKRQAKAQSSKPAATESATASKPKRTKIRKKKVA